MAASYPPQQQQVPAASVPSTRVELHLSCKKLKDKDLLSKSDPIVSVRVKDAKTGSWREVTECVAGCELATLIPYVGSRFHHIYPQV